jgi:hypothetical protein
MVKPAPRTTPDLSRFTIPQANPLTAPWLTAEWPRTRTSLQVLFPLFSFRLRAVDQSYVFS